MIGKMQETQTISATIKGNRQLRKSVRLSTKVTKSSEKLKVKSERLSSSDAGVSFSNEHDKARSKFTDKPDGSVPNQPTTEDHVSSKRRKKKRMHCSSSSIINKKKRSKHPTKDEEEKSDEGEVASFNRAGDSRKNMSEERRALHRVHERQRHQSLNDAIQELVKVLPPGDVYRNVTKFNVLRKANDYIDFLQYKINHLCLDGSIEQKREECRLSFNVPLKATFDGKELKIPASTPISPKLLRDIKKAAKIVSTNQQSDKLALKPNKVRTTQTPTPRYSGLRSKKTPREKLKTGDTQNTPAGGFPKEVPYTDRRRYSKIPKKLTYTDPGGYSSDVFPDSHMDTGGYSTKKASHTDRGHSEDVPHTDPGSYSERVPHSDPGGYSKKFPYTDLGGNSEDVPHRDPGDYSKKASHTDPGHSEDVPHTDPGSYSERVPHSDPGGYSKRVLNTDPGGYSEKVPQRDPGDYSKKVPHNNPEGYSKRVPHTDPGGYSVPHTDPGVYSERIFHSDPGGYSKKVPHTDPGGYSVPRTDPEGYSREVPRVDPRPAPPQGEDMYESDQGELVVDEEPLSLRKIASAEIDSLCTIKQISKEPSNSLPIVSRKSSQRRKMKNPCQRKAASLSHDPSTSLDREQRKRLLDYYISADSSPDSVYSIPTDASKPTGVPASAKPGSGVDSEGETSFQTPCVNHLEHSYTANSHQSYLTGINSEARLPSELSSVGGYFNQPMESSRVDPSETTTSQVKTHNMGPGYLGQIDQKNSSNHLHKSNANSTAMPTWKTKETTLSNNADLGCSCVMQTREVTQPMVATSVPLPHSNVIDSTSSVCYASVKSTSLTGMASSYTTTTAPYRFLTSSTSLVYKPAEASSLSSSNMTTTSTAEIVSNQYSTAMPTALVNQSTTTSATLPPQIIKISKPSENKLLHYSIILPTSIVDPSKAPTLQPTLTKQQITLRKTEPLQSFTFMPSNLAQHSQVATTPQTPTSCDTALLHYSTVYPAAPVHQSTKPANLPIRNIWTSQTSNSGSHRYLTFMPTARTQKDISATNLPATTFRKTVVPEQHSVMPDAQVRHCTVASSTPNENSALMSSGKTVSLHYTTVLPNTRIYYTTATSKTIPTQHMRPTTASRVAPLLFSNASVSQSTAASPMPVQKVLMTSCENTLCSPTAISSSMTQHDSEKFTFMPTTDQLAAPKSTLPVPTSANKTTAYYYAVPSTQVTTATTATATATAMSTNNTFMTLVPKTFPHRHSNILPNNILHHTTVPATQPLETAQITTACETAHSYVTTATSSQATAAPTSTTTEQSKSTPQRYVAIQPATTGSNDTAPIAPTLQKVAIYEACTDMILQKNQATVSIAQTLVVDASFLQFEESESPLEIPGGSESPVSTATAAPGCSLRRSWINGYQLFTKVNHPKFRDKWPQLQGRDITKLLSQVWKELPGDSKKHYSRRAREWNQWHRRKREPANKEGKEE